MHLFENDSLPSIRNLFLVLRSKHQYFLVPDRQVPFLVRGGAFVPIVPIAATPMVIIVSALSLSLRDKDRLRDWEIERAWQWKSQVPKLNFNVFEYSEKISSPLCLLMVVFRSWLLQLARVREEINNLLTGWEYHELNELYLHFSWLKNRILCKIEFLYASSVQFLFSLRNCNKSINCSCRFILPFLANFLRKMFESLRQFLRVYICVSLETAQC